MAEACISVDQDQFTCPICLDLLKDPVTINCGHSFCMECINKHWDKNHQSGVYSCPQCREKFTPRPGLRRNNMLAEVVEKVKEMEAASRCFAGAGDVECDFCTGRKLKARKSCLVCVASLCETHLKPHLQIPALVKHQLVEATTRLQEKICPQHDRLMEIYCRTDESCICCLCLMDQHKGHDTVLTAAERTEKQSELKKMKMKSQQNLQEKEKMLQELRHSLKTLKHAAQAAVEDSERFFTELICSIKRKCSQVTELIKAHQETQLRQTEGLLKKLEQEISELKSRHTELEKLSETEDHIQFLQTIQSLSFARMDSPGVTVPQHFSFDELRESISELKLRLEKFCNEELRLLDLPAPVLPVLPPKPTTREDFLWYFCQLTMDPNTVNHKLTLSEENRVVRWRGGPQRYPDHPERFDRWPQVLCKESLSGRSYWEVELDRGGWGVSISVSYKGISRKGDTDECAFGGNRQSWSLLCSSVLSFWHNNLETKLPVPSSSRVGVFVDDAAGTLSFYSIDDRMTLLHTIHTTFTQPLYAGFWLKKGKVKLCDRV